MPELKPVEQLKMNGSDKIIECVPNFSEGRNPEIIKRITGCFNNRKGVKLLDFTSDADHNRMVITAAGYPEEIKNSILDAIEQAVLLIDLTKHKGVHPRMGAADVIPFIPIQNLSDVDAIEFSKDIAKNASERFDLPVYLYEKSATAPHRKNLADVRKGEFEGLINKMKDPLWLPDYGPDRPHNTAGASIIGTRNYLIAYNVNLKTDNLEIAKSIAKKIRFSSGGFEECKAMGVLIDNGLTAQVSMNLTDYNITSMFKVYDAICKEAEKYDVEIKESELIGMLPIKAVADITGHYLKIKDFSAEKILEYKLFD